MKLETSKIVIVWTCAVVAFLTGIGLMIGGFFVPPTGEVSGSLLTGIGELLSFAGGIFGISGYTGIKLKELDNENERLRNKVN